MFGGRLGVPELVIVFLLFGVPTIAAWWKIFVKAGHPGALSLTRLIPGVGFFVLLWFAFSEWPIEKNLAAAPSPTTGSTGPR